MIDRCVDSSALSAPSRRIRLSSITRPMRYSRRPRLPYLATPSQAARYKPFTRPADQLSLLWIRAISHVFHLLIAFFIMLCRDHLLTLR